VQNREVERCERSGRKLAAPRQRESERRDGRNFWVHLLRGDIEEGRLWAASQNSKTTISPIFNSQAIANSALIGAPAPGANLSTSDRRMLR